MLYTLIHRNKLFFPVLNERHPSRSKCKYALYEIDLYSKERHTYRSKCKYGHYDTEHYFKQIHTCRSKCKYGHHKIDYYWKRDILADLSVSMATTR